MTKRAVLYARVSSDDRGNGGRNLSGQLDMCREYAREHCWHIVAELAEDDRGASGASFELPQLSKVLEIAEAGEFDVLAVRELDRLSRNLAKQLIVEEELRRHGVEVEYVLADYPDTPEGRLNKHIRATIAEYEREKIAERMVRGKWLKVKAGNVMVHGRPPFGYRVGEVDGKTMLAIHEPEAQIVQWMFTWYTEGDGEDRPFSLGEIADKLEAMVVPLPSGGKRKWHRTTIHWMLKSETYAGTWHYGKQSKHREPIAVSVPAIVSRETWQAAQLRMLDNKGNAKRNTKREYLLRRRVTCGACGLKVTSASRITGGKLYKYYRCPAHYGGRHEYSRSCDQPTFRADQVDALVWGWVKSFVMDPDALAKGLREHHQECERENQPIRARLEVVDDLLADNRRQLERLLDLYLSGEFPKNVLTDRKSRLERMILDLERERASLVTHLEASLLSAKQVQTLQEFSVKVGAKLEAMDDDFKAKRGLIEALDMQTTLMSEDGQKVVYTRCMLGEASLSVASNRSRAPLHARQPSAGSIPPPRAYQKQYQGRTCPAAPGRLLCDRGPL